MQIKGENQLNSLMQTMKITTNVTITNALNAANKLSTFHIMNALNEYNFQFFLLVKYL